MEYVKVHCEGMARSIAVDKFTDFSTLKHRISTLFPQLETEDFVVKFEGDKGDCFTINSDEGFVEAKRMVRMMRNSSLELSAVPMTVLDLTHSTPVEPTPSPLPSPSQMLNAKEGTTSACASACGASSISTAQWTTDFITSSDNDLGTETETETETELFTSVLSESAFALERSNNEDGGDNVRSSFREDSWVIQGPPSKHLEVGDDERERLAQSAISAYLNLVQAGGKGDGETSNEIQELTLMVASLVQVLQPTREAETVGSTTSESASLIHVKGPPAPPLPDPQSQSQSQPHALAHSNVHLSQLQLEQSSTTFDANYNSPATHPHTHPHTHTPTHPPPPVTIANQSTQTNISQSTQTDLCTVAVASDVNDGVGLPHATMESTHGDASCHLSLSTSELGAWAATTEIGSIGSQMIIQEAHVTPSEPRHRRRTFPSDVHFDVGAEFDVENPHQSTVVMKPTLSRRLRVDSSPSKMTRTTEPVGDPIHMPPSHNGYPIYKGEARPESKHPAQVPGLGCSQLLGECFLIHRRTAQPHTLRL